MDFGGAVDIVLGVSMAPTSVRMLLVEGENADGLTVEDNNFDIATDDEAATLSASDQVISAILGTQEGATQAGHALTSTGITWTDPVDAAALRQALASRKIENVMLVSAFMAAAALTQMVGSTVGNAHTALLFLEPDTATLAVVDSADGSITEVHKQLISGANTVAELAGMVAGLDALETRPQSVFVVGSGVDIAALKPQLEAVTSIPVTAADEPETALAWGAALASANAPLFASSTAALAYAQDPGTGEIDPYAVAPGYLAVPDVPLGTELGEEDLAYSAVPDEEAEANTAVLDEPTDEHLDSSSERRPLLLVGSVLAVVAVAAALALEVSLALGIRPSVALLPRPLQNLIVPTQQAPAPAPAPASAPIPQVNHVPAPVVGPPPVHAAIPAPPPAAPLPAPVPAAPPAPVAAPAPVVAPPAPVLIPLPLPIPVRPPMPVQVAPLHAPAPAPVHLPVPQPPVYLPPPVHPPAPQPPVSLPARPPVGVPVWPAPVHLPAPQPPVHLPAPQPPVHFPAPQDPVQVGAPQLPVQLPASEPPVRMPAPVMPAPEAPAVPALPVPMAPGIPGMPAPEAPPVMRAPAAPPDSPHVPEVGAPPAQGPSPSSPGSDTGGDRGFGGPGGFGGGDRGFGGPGGFGGGDRGSGGFGGGDHGFGGFGGGGFGGGFGGGGGGFGGGGGHGGGGHR
jgi:hypothetical protein